MTTEELIKKLRENKLVDVVVITALDGVKKLVILNDMRNPLFRLPTTATNWLELESVHSQLIADSLGKESRECVAEQISEYLDTPLDKRKPEKKYRLRWMDNEDDGAHNYLDNRYGIWSCETDTRLYTESDIKQLKELNPHLAPAIEAMKEEVKDDAC